MKFYIFVWSFFGGVFLASVWKLPLAATSFLLLVVLSIFLTLHFAKNKDAVFKATNSRNYFYLGLIILLAILVGACRMEIGKLHKNNTLLFSNLDKSVAIIGVVIGEPDQRENSTNLIILPTKILDRTIDKNNKEKILVRAPPNSEFQYGDEVKVSGKLELPQKIDGDNGRSFNYPEYLAKDNIYYLMNRATAEVISTGHANVIKRGLFKLKRAFLSSLNNLLPLPYSGFMGGLIIAGKKSLPPDLLAQFQKTGTLQIVVLSGYNITIVAEAMMKMFSFLPGVGGLTAGAVSIILFSIMAGGASTIIRAAVMALISILGKATHRVYDARRALFLAGFLMVFQNPRILAYDPSFQLSFMATLGLMMLSPFFDRHLRFLPEKYQIRATASATLSAQVFVTPLILFEVGQVSLVSVPANILMMAVVPTIMLTGFLTGLIGFLGRIVALPLTFISYFLLSYELFVLKFFANIPFALISIPFPFWLLVATYGIYVCIFFKKKKSKDRAPRGGAVLDLSNIADIKILED